MRQTISITIEHSVVASNRSYEQVKESLEARLGVAGNTDELVRQLAAVNASWEQVTQAIEKQLGTSGFSLFSKVDHGVLLSLALLLLLEQFYFDIHSSSCASTCGHACAC